LKEFYDRFERKFALNSISNESLNKNDHFQRKFIKQNMSEADLLKCLNLNGILFKTDNLQRKFI